MGREERLLLRLAMRVTSFLFIFLIVVSGSGAYYGRRGTWMAVIIGIPALVLVYARVIAGLRGTTTPERRMWEAAKRGGRRASLDLARGLAALHAARRRGRVRRVEKAASESGDDLLSPEGIRTAGESLFRLVQLAWDARDEERLATVAGPELMARWRHELPRVREKGGAKQRREVLGDVRVDYVGFESGASPRAVVLVEATIRTYTEHRGERRTDEDTSHLSEYWTLGLREGAWTVLGVEERRSGRHHLKEPIGGSEGHTREPALSPTPSA